MIMHICKVISLYNYYLYYICPCDEINLMHIHYTYIYMYVYKVITLYKQYLYSICPCDEIDLICIHIFMYIYIKLFHYKTNIHMSL